jgi:asparagine synthase (glutamine-hydrolysing)
MHRYIAFAWDPDHLEMRTLVEALDRTLLSTNSGWQRVLDADGLHIYVFGPSSRAFQAYRLTRERGVVLGVLMAQDFTSEGAADATLKEGDTQRIWESKGQHLVDRFWGRYVLLMKPEIGPGLIALRDPTGAIPCFTARFQEIDLVCSHIDDCDELGLISPDINWNHIAAYLRFDNMITAHTGLKGVRQVQAGERIALSRGRIDAEYCWNPNEVYGARTIDDPLEAMQELRKVVQWSVAAWAGCYEYILHELSGGLDSAVVLACLSRAHKTTRVLCENHYTEKVEGDERAFARQAAKAAGVDLVETPIIFPDCTLEAMLDQTRVASPTLVSFVPATRLHREEIIKHHGIEAVFSGQGGDHFFQSIPTRQIAAEYFLRHGVSKELLDVISDTSLFVRRSFWSVLGAVIASGMSGSSVDPYRILRTSPLLSDAARNDSYSKTIRHPWVDSAVGMPACKRRQVFDIIDTQNFYHTSGQAVDVVHPLISQPVIELCLQIPSYILTYGGRDRALIRDAFKGLVPAAIIDRRSKGATTGYFNKVLVQNAAFLREYLLGGLLAAQGLIDKDRTEAALSESALVRGATLIFPMLDALRAEFWLRRWSDRSRRSAA